MLPSLLTWHGEDTPYRALLSSMQLLIDNRLPRNLFRIRRFSRYYSCPAVKTIEEPHGPELPSNEPLLAHRVVDFWAEPVFTDFLFHDVITFPFLVLIFLTCQSVILGLIGILPLLHSEQVKYLG